MKEKWLMAWEGSWEALKPRITTALESGFDCVVVRPEYTDQVRKLGGIKVACFGNERNLEDILIIGRGGEGDGSAPYRKISAPPSISTWRRPERERWPATSRSRTKSTRTSP
jgi:3-dehydroquinate synthase II